MTGVSLRKKRGPLQRVKGNRSGGFCVCRDLFACFQPLSLFAIVPCSASYSSSKASFIVALLEDFEKGKISMQRLVASSDREAARALRSLKGLGDWSVAQVLTHFLKRADIMCYGDLTLRNYLNDLYEISHNVQSETMVESAADFPDTAANRNLMDALALKNGWAPYRSVVLYLMYHLQEENLVLV